jgi:hypothetical protein
VDIISYKEIHWLQFGIDYTVTNLNDQDVGGTLTMITTIPPEAEQIVIKRNTPKTQEIDLHNGARLPAELIETMSNKLTMITQENAEQIIRIDDGNILINLLTKFLRELLLK